MAIEQSPEQVIGVRTRTWLSRLSLPSRIVISQIVIGAATAAVLLSMSRAAAWAAVLASLVIVLPNLVFVAQLKRADKHRPSPAAAVQQARRFLLQGVQRFVLTVLLVGAVFIVGKPAPLAFFATLLLLQAAYLLAGWLDPLRKADSTGSSKVS